MRRRDQHALACRRFRATPPFFADAIAAAISPRQPARRQRCRGRRFAAAVTAFRRHRRYAYFAFHFRLIRLRRHFRLRYFRRLFREARFKVSDADDSGLSLAFAFARYISLFRLIFFY